jgi:hypothetical protein
MVGPLDAKIAERCAAVVGSGYPRGAHLGANADGESANGVLACVSYFPQKATCAV